jgi:ribosomal protein S18 acetylase RimI-like enzyme
MGRSHFQIRRLAAADAADYRAIRLAALKGDALAFGSTYEAEAGRPLTHFAERLATSAVHAAYGEAGVLGMAGFKRQAGARDRHKGFVWGTYVRPEMRRQGVARALMEAVVGEASTVVEQLTLCVVQDNAAALALYRELGFEVYGVEPRALKGAGGYADEVLMVRFLARPS